MAQTVYLIAKPESAFIKAEIKRRIKRTLILLSIPSSIILWLASLLGVLQFSMAELIGVTFFFFVVVIPLRAFEFYYYMWNNGIFLGPKSIGIYHDGHKWDLRCPIMLDTNTAGSEWLLTETKRPERRISLPFAAYPNLNKILIDGIVAKSDD